MNSKLPLQITLPIVVLALGGLGARALVQSREHPESSPPPVILPVVQTIVAQAQDHQVEVPARGTVVPRTESDLVVQVSGKVLSVSPNLASGGFFEKDDLLLTLDPRDYELGIAQAELVVAQAKRRLAEEEADAAVARREWAELGEGPGSPLALREPHVAEAKASVTAAEAALERANLDLERTRVRAPFAGRVRAKHIDVGQFLVTGNSAARIYAVDYAEIRLPLSDEELAFLELPIHRRNGAEPVSGPLVLLSTEFAGARREWTAQIVRTEGEIDPKTRMVVAVARVEDPYGAGRESGTIPLAVGLFIDAAIEGVLLRDVFVLPRSAMRDGSRIYLLDDEDRLLIQEIEVVRSEREVVVVRGEIEDGDRIVISPLEIATNRMHVRDVAQDIGLE
jgi:membrane fusion protein, multidrug efflux system